MPCSSAESKCFSQFCSDYIQRLLSKKRKGLVSHGQSSYWTTKSSFLFLTSNHTEAENLGPKLHPWMDFLDHDFFIILKNSHQDLSNEGSNFTLSSPEVGH